MESRPIDQNVWPTPFMLLRKRRRSSSGKLIPVQAERNGLRGQTCRYIPLLLLRSKSRQQQQEVDRAQKLVPVLRGGAPHIIQWKSFISDFKSFGWSVPDVPGRMSSTRARLRRSMKIVRGRLGIAVYCGGHLALALEQSSTGRTIFFPCYGEKRAGETEIGENWNHFLHYWESLFFGANSEGRTIVHPYVKSPCHRRAQLVHARDRAFSTVPGRARGD